MAHNSNNLKNEINIDKFVNLYCLGLSPKDIYTEMGFSDTTYYMWLKDKNIIRKISEVKQILHTTGQDFVKLRYNTYLKNIDKLCNDMSDKRTCLSANQFMIEKIDGKSNQNITIDTKQDTEEYVNKLDELKNKYNIVDEDEAEEE